MGDLYFRVPHPSQIDPRVWETAYISGIEGIPWYCRRRLEGDQFIIGRDIDESGKLHIVWPTKSLGNLCLTTTSLRVIDQSYSLLLELARGSVSKLKNQCDEWQRIGLKLPSEFFPANECALDAFLKAVTLRNDNAKQDELAQSSIEASTEAAIILCDAYCTQVLEVRRQSEGRFSTLLGCTVHPSIAIESVSEALKTAFNLVNVEADLCSVESASGRRDYEVFDQQVAWAQASGQRISVGPLVNFRQGGLPRWMVLLDQSFESTLRAACEHTQVTVERYRGKVHLWNCAAGLNIPGDMRWSDEEVLRMSVSLIETVRRADDRTPVLLTIDQPWSEYLGNERDGISPLHFADALIRADLGLSGLSLELNLSAWPNGSLPRDPIEISRLIDRWSVLGLPLMIELTSPTQVDVDKAATQATNVATWSMNGSPPAVGLSCESILRMLLAKPTVHAIVWNQTSDQIPHRFPHGGLWDANGKAKPILTKAANLRATYLH